MKKNIILSAYILFTILFISCNDKSDLTSPLQPSTGNANFDNFISIGNSLTAGYQNSALYQSGQEYSYGKLIANQIGVDYTQPTIDDPGIGGRLEVSSINPFVTISQSLIAGLPNNIDQEGSYNNLGVPGAKLKDILDASSSTTSQDSSNFFFDIVLQGKGTVLEQVISSNPTIATLWIGNNDILGYVLSGGTTPHTSRNDFADLYDKLCDSLANLGIPIIVANLPNPQFIPFVNTVGTQLINEGITEVYGINSDGMVELMNLSKNLLTFGAQEELDQNRGHSITTPLSNSVILDENELQITQNVTSAFNATISNLSVKYGFYIIDMNSFFTEIYNNGITADGISFTTEYIYGGLFSLDGVHPTSQGYAIIANQFIRTINTNLSADIPEINISTIPGSIKLNKNLLSNKITIPKYDKRTFYSIFY